MSEKLDLDALEKLLAAATPAPWHNPTGGRNIDQPGWRQQSCMNRAEDATLVCALRNAAPSMLAELRVLRRVAAEAKEYRSAETADMGFELWKHEAHGRRVDATGDALDAALKEAGL